MSRLESIFSGVLGAAIIVAAAVMVAVSCGGCRTYYVYQFGLGDNEILVEAEVLKEINPQVKASLK
jgi:hypothetical protein